MGMEQILSSEYTISANMMLIHLQLTSQLEWYSLVFVYTDYL
jgi:hypothetical protein